MYGWLVEILRLVTSTSTMDILDQEDGYACIQGNPEKRYGLDEKKMGMVRAH